MRHPNKVSISVAHKLIVSMCIPQLFHIASLVLSLLQFFHFLALRSGVSCSSSQYLGHYFLPFITVLFHPTFCLGHRSVFNLSTFCTSLWEDGQKLEWRKDYAADVNWLVLSSCLEVLLNFILQEMFIFKMLSSFQLGSCIRYARDSINNLSSRYTVLPLQAKSSKKLQDVILRRVVCQDKCFSFEHEINLQKLY